MASQQFLTMILLLFIIPVVLFQPTNSMRLARKPTTGSEVVCRSDSATNRKYQLEEVSEESFMERKPEALSKLHYLVGLSGFGLDEEMRTLMDKSKPCVNTLDLPVSNITIFHDDVNNVNTVYYHRIKNVTLGETNQSISLDFFGNGQPLKYATSSTVLKARNGSLILQRLCGMDDNITIVTILSTDSNFPIGNQTVLTAVERELEMNYNITLSFSADCSKSNHTLTKDFNGNGTNQHSFTNNAVETGSQNQSQPTKFWFTCQTDMDPEYYITTENEGAIGPNATAGKEVENEVKELQTVGNTTHSLGNRTETKLENNEVETEKKNTTPKVNDHSMGLLVTVAVVLSGLAIVVVIIDRVFVVLEGRNIRHV